LLMADRLDPRRWSSYVPAAPISRVLASANGMAQPPVTRHALCEREKQLMEL
jgi:hypothetical protein